MLIVDTRKMEKGFIILPVVFFSLIVVIVVLNIIYGRRRVGFIRHCLRYYKSEHKNIQVAERRFRNMPGSADREIALTNQNTGLQNFN